LRKIIHLDTTFDDEELHEIIELGEILKSLKYQNYLIKKVDSFLHLITYILANKKNI